MPRTSAPGRDGARVAAALGVHEHTLARLAKRLAGATLRDVACSGPDALAAAMQERLLGSGVLRKKGS